MDSRISLDAASRKRRRTGSWIVASCFTGSLLFALFQGGKLAYMLFMIVFLLTLYLMLGRWSGIASIRGKRLMEKDQRMPGFPAGTSIPVCLQFEIPGIWPLPYVIVKERLISHRGDAHQFELTFVPDWKRRGAVSYLTPPLRRGFYRFAETVCSTEDVFGLFEHQGKIDAGDTFAVLPQTVPIREWNELMRYIRGSQFHSHTTRSFRETTQINGVREYVYGDRISRIHWNATARTGTWKSKEFERETLPRTIMLLDRGRQAYGDSGLFELAVSAAASVMEYGRRADVPIGLLSVGETSFYLEPGVGDAHYRRAVAHLTGVECDGDGGWEIALKRVGERLPRGSFFVIVSPRTPGEWPEAARWLSSRQMIYCQLWIRPEAAGAVSQPARLGRQDYWVYPLSRLEELPGVLGGRQA